MNQPSTYWTLTQALWRTTNLEGPDHLWAMVERGELIAYGRRHGRSDREWIPTSICRLLIDRDFQTSCLRGAGECFMDVVIYPVLYAPNALDILDGMTLKQAFWQFVLQDPEVKILAERAIANNGDLERVYASGKADPYDDVDWCVLGGIGENCYDHDDPFGQVQEAAATLSGRFDRLMSFLRDQRLEALGDPVSPGGTHQVLPSIWSHSNYFFKVHTGEVYRLDCDGIEFITSCLVRRLRSEVRRWCAVMLKKPPQSRTSHVKPVASDEKLPLTIDSALSRGSRNCSRKHSAKRESLYQAVNVLWGGRVPKTLSRKSRNGLIIEWLEKSSLPKVDPRTINRCFE
jgi:hypothetical protein